MNAVNEEGKKRKRIVDEGAKKRKRTVDEEADGVLLSKLFLGQEKRRRKQEKKNKIEEPKKKKALKKTSQIEEEEEEEDETEKKKSNQFRSTWPEVDSFREVLDEEALNELRNGPFGLLFEGFYEHVNKKHFGKSNKLIETIADTYNEKLDAFVIGEGRYRITSRDVSEILGLPRKGGFFETMEVEENAAETLFGKNKRVTKKCVMDALRELKDQQPTNDEERRKKRKNLVRLLILEICIKFLFANGGGSVSNELVNAVWGNIQSCGWAQEVRRFLSGCLRQRLKSKGKGLSGLNTGGCAHLILVCIFGN